ncbi:MAG: acetyl/propionyl/methylcrotonyl-CoA carboxylase subunit alpha [Ktedonobacteraceae bacterium]
MFKKVLIANRGEIAIRIMATCREMGIRTVAIYSAADCNARHVREADEAYFVGPAPAAQSYLRIDTIIDVARQSRAEAIHPGYGFLSENVHFVEECKEAGIVFIGPPASAMRLMGSKISAKQLAQSVGAPTIPGYNGEDQEASTLTSEAKRIGFPLLIKASAGGGGKGMRVVNTLDDFKEHLAGAQREALASFGDATVFLERLLQKPRHIEIQVLGDTFGNLIHLGERECSIQRRHQKIVEESPSTALTPALREEMGATAVRIAQAAGYVNAGTLEFLLDTDNHFYFLEMNTRLQVEHAVTELVTGIDLVRHQLQIAAGQPLSLTQEQIIARGHSIEVRIYAEDPETNFLPSTGTVSRFTKPEGPGIRIDSGIESNDEISQFYDPMIAKLIVYGEDRTAAIERLQAALKQQAIFGVKTNSQLLLAIATHPAFQAGVTFTNFLEEYALLESETTQQTNSDQENVFRALIAAAVYDFTRVDENRSPGNGHIPSNPWKALGPWRMLGETRKTTYIYQGTKYQVALSPSKDITGAWTVQVDTRPVRTISTLFGNDNFVLLRLGSSQIHTFVRSTESEVQVNLDGGMYFFEKRQPPNADVAAHGGNKVHSQKALTAPMAGTIIKVQVRNGEIVHHRQVLVILSAMKMEHSILAPYEGKVRRVHFHEGEVVKGGAVIIEME